MREGGLPEGREESAGEKRWEESVPPDHCEVIVLRPFIESNDSAYISEMAWKIPRNFPLPFGFEVSSANVVDEQGYVQVRELVRDPGEINVGAGGVY